MSGGGSASPVWLGMLADVTGVPVIRSADAESGARGAFIVGLLATGRARDAREAADAHIRPGDSYTPDTARAAHYAQAYEDFLAVRTATAPAWPTRRRPRPHRPGDTPPARCGRPAGGRGPVSAVPDAEAVWVGVDLGTQGCARWPSPSPGRWSAPGAVH